jgi:uncharacterized protein YkwD
MKTLFRVMRFMIAVVAVMGFVAGIVTLLGSDPHISALPISLVWLVIAVYVLKYDTKASQRDNYISLTKRKWFNFAMLGAMTCVFVAVFLAVAITLAEQPDDIQIVSAENNQQTEIPIEEITPDGLYLSINETRATYGLPLFVRNPLLDKSSAYKCDDMVQNHYYEHTNPVSGKPGGSYAQDVGATYSWVSENLNMGDFNTNQQVVDSWMGSTAHMESILDPDFTDIGFAACIDPESPSKVIVVQHKTKP